MLDGVALRGREVNEIAASLSGSSPDPPPSPSASGCAVGVGSIEHCVSKMDTLAGIAIKYGVEVADIKRMNGLVTDLQMFAHEKLQIPLPGRHPPSPILLKGSSSNGEHTPRNRRHHSDILESFQSLKLNSSNQRASPAMSILQGYYGLTTPKKSVAAEGTELTLPRTNRTFNFEDEVFPRVSPLTEPLCQKSRTLVNGSSLGNGLLAKDAIVTEVQENGEADISSTEKSVRRRQKNDADSNIIGDSSGRAGKGLAPRPKSGSRTDLDSAHTNTLIIGDSFMADGFMSVRKSSSTSNLQEPTTKRTTKSDVISRPIFDGLPKPLTSRRNKAALD